MADVSAVGMGLTVIGSILSGGITGHFAARSKARHELEAWQRSRDALITDSAVTLLKDTVGAIAAAAHAACWLSLKAERDPGSVTDQDLERYEEEMWTQFPKMLGGQAAIGIFCPDAAAKVQKAVAIIAGEDKEIGRTLSHARLGDRSPLAARQPHARKAYFEACRLCDGLGAQLLKGRATGSALGRLARLGRLGVPPSDTADRADGEAAGGRTPVQGT
ncbi:MAG TPA: hypothetical protein VK403_12775 [Allosphingosinicella sp.]|nr:hypothetical protein [Allosphingosinicella sp.]